MMMRRWIWGVLFMATGLIQLFAQEDIAEARTMGIGNSVTVSGIVTNGEELGTIRYMQDPSGGIAIYSTEMSGVNRGDSVTVTGVLKEYNTLLELDPVSSVTVHSTGHILPEPVELTPSQLSEAYEGMVVRILQVEFDASGTFARQSYTFTAQGESGQIYINSYDSPLIGTIIPTVEISLSGPLGSYSNIYQVLPRDLDDLVPSSMINLTGLPLLSNLESGGFTVSWNTDTAGTTQAFYGNTPDLELGVLAVPGDSKAHSLELSGLEPSELIYMQPFSVLGSDTAKAAMQVYITRSVSSGEILTYFTRSVDPSVSLGLLEARHLDRAMDDTLVAYIDRAEESIDMTVYNLDNYGITNITYALNSAHDRGVTVRVVYDGENNADGVQYLHQEIGKIASPLPNYPFYNIMHNKFVVFDANAADPDKPVVWTGSTNLTDNQIHTDPNNVIVIQDQSLAKAFQLEFNEMFGSEGAQPDESQARFGPDKKDNTPREFIINGKRVELYFSPSDGTHSKILSAIASADHSIHIASMLITREDIGEDLAARNEVGVDVKVLLNDYDQYGEPVVNTLVASLQEDVRLKGESGIMHHKYMIVDQGNAVSDPVLLTGSHNWSASAQLRNDENTLIIHDQGVANAYYQEFVERFGRGELLVDQPECEDDQITMTEGSSIQHDVLANDNLPGTVTVSIISAPKHGTARVEQDWTITYYPDSTFNQDWDTIGYRVCLDSNPALCDSARMIVHVDKPTAIQGSEALVDVNIYPNPATRNFFVSASNGYYLDRIVLMDLSGKIVLDQPADGWSTAEINREGFNPGIYILRITCSDGSVMMKKIAFR